MDTQSQDQGGAEEVEERSGQWGKVPIVALKVYRSPQRKVIRRDASRRRRMEVLTRELWSAWV